MLLEVVEGSLDNASSLTGLLRYPTLKRLGVGMGRACARLIQAGIQAHLFLYSPSLAGLTYRSVL